MRRGSLLALLLAVGCWLGAGPGGITLQAVLACRHHAALAGEHSHHMPTVPPGAPCFCDQMTGGNDLLPSAAVMTPVPIATLVVVAEAAHVFPAPPSPFPGFSPDLLTPPPIA
jgi:hypothetical protein